MRTWKLSPLTGASAGKPALRMTPLLSPRHRLRCHPLWSSSYRREGGSSCRRAIFFSRGFFEYGKSEGKSSPRIFAAVALCHWWVKKGGNQAPFLPEPTSSEREIG